LGKGTITKNMVYFIIFFLLASSFVAHPDETEPLRPTLDLEHIDPSSGYFGLEIKWSVEKKMDFGISAKVTYMDPELFLASVDHEAESKKWSPQERWTPEQKEEKKKEILNLLREYLAFRIFLKHPDDPDYTKITDWHVLLVDDLQNKYSPEKIEEGKGELRKGFAGPYYGRISYAYFPRYRTSDGKPVLHEGTRWMKIELSQSSITKEFEWIFFQEGKGERSPFYFYPYLKASLLVLLILLIFLVWITRPGKALRNIRST